MNFTTKFKNCLLTNILIVSMFLVCGCNAVEKERADYLTVANNISSETTVLDTEAEIVVTENSATSEDSVEASTPIDSISTDIIPEYSGEQYIVLNENIPNLSKEDGRNSFERYSNLDELGRCGVAYINACKETMPTEERGEIGHIRPSGWHTVKYNSVIDGKYLYNRCHLAPWCLCGFNGENNLITGTRQFNVEGMLPFETKVANYIDRTNHHVLYRVTPIFDGDNLVAKGVQMEALSVEDDEICFNVFVYNVQDHIEIDYATGESCLADDFTVVSNDIATEVTTTEDLEVITETEIVSSNNNEDIGTTYILNTNTMKIHKPTCDSVNDIKEHNKKESNSSIEELENNGYIKCKRCF